MVARLGWDPDKAAQNIAAQNILKHGVGFSEASRVFLGPSSVTKEDRIVDGEQRWQTLGTVRGQMLLVVVHTGRDDDGVEVIRMISARRAERWEWTNYEEENG